MNLNAITDFTKVTDNTDCVEQIKIKMENEGFLISTRRVFSPDVLISTSIDDDDLHIDLLSVLQYLFRGLVLFQNRPKIEINDVEHALEIELNKKNVLVLKEDKTWTIEHIVASDDHLPINDYFNFM